MPGGSSRAAKSSSICTTRISTAISNTIEVFVGRLRKKLGVDVLQTVRGLGYMMDSGDAGNGARK